MRKIILVTVLFSLLASFAVGQCPTAGFNAPDSTCAGSTFQVTNTSTGGFSDLWDFCGGDLKTVPQTSMFSTDGALNFPQQIRFVNDNGTYHMFVANLFGQNLLRYDFGNSVNNVPTLFDYGNIGGLFNWPSGLDVVNDNGTWYAVVSNFNANNVVVVNLGNTISANTATGAAFGSFNLVTPRGVKIAKDGNDYYAFISNGDPSNDLTKISFGNSLGNTPTGFAALTDPLFNASWGFDVAFDCSLGKWVGFYASLGLSKINVIDFGTSLSNAGTIATSITSVDNPSGINLLHEGDSWYLIMNSFTNAQFQKIRLNGDLLSAPADLITHIVPQNTNPRGVTSFHDSTGTHVFVTCNQGSAISKLFFSSACTTVPSLSTSPSTVDVTTTINNNYQVITLNVTSANGLTSYYTDSVYINEAPQTGFIYSAACEGQLVSFTDTSILNPNLTTTWSWDFDDASPLDPNQNPVHIFPVTDTYNVTLTATYPSGCFTTFSDSVFVAPNPVADFSFLNNQCSFTEVSFSDLSQAFAGTTVISWSWDFGDTTTVDTTQNPVHTYTTAGNFNVVLTVTTDAGCIDSVLTTITIIPSPEANFDVFSTCIGDSAQFDNATIIQGGINVNYHWSFGDSDTSLLEDPSHLYTAVTANYDVTLIAIAINGCSDTIMQNIRISNKPVAQFTWTPTVVCEGNSVNFTSTSFGTGGDTISTYIWDFDDGNFSNDMNPIYAFGDTGYFNVNLTVLSPTYCDSSVTQQVYVIPSPTASFTATGVCLGLTTIFNPSTTTPPNTMIDSIVWTYGDGFGFSGLASPVHLYDTAGKFPVTMTVYNNFGCTGTFEDSVDVYPIPTAAFTYSTLCTDSLASFDGTSSSVINDSLTSWLWNFDNQGSGIGSTTSFTFADSGSFDVTLIVTSLHGCSDTTMQSIHVIQSPEFDFIFNEPCSAQVATFNFIPVDTIAPATLTWYFGDSNSSGALIATHTYATVDTFLVTLNVVHNLTGCASKLEKNLVVHPYPVAGFSFVNNCEGLPIQFTDTSTIESGTLNTWAWNFGSLGISNNQNPAVISQNPGKFPAILSVTSTAGCITTANDSFTVFANPVAAFTPDPLFGSPPLNVNFVNSTLGATSYAWNFGNGTTGIGFSPNVTYGDTGIYQISLVASSSEGCIDSTHEFLSVLFPFLDIAVNKVFATQTGTFLGLKAEIINYGNVPVTHFQIGGKIDNETAIVETWVGQLQPGAVLNYQFNASLLIDVESPPGFFCVEVSDPNFLVDEVPENNILCDVLGKSFELYTAFPNPFTENLSIAFNLPDEDFFNIQIYDAIGKLVYESLNQEGLTGYNQVNISTINFRKGIYVLKLDYRDKNTTMNLLRY